MNINGLSVNAVKFSDDTKLRIESTLKALRPSIHLPEDAMKSFRFNSNDHVIWLLASGVTEAEVNENMEEACRLGLIEAARADHWYEYEKDWE